MPKIRVLVVEDDEATISDWRRQVERHNAAGQFTLAADYLQTAEQALEWVDTRRCDMAVVDLRLRKEVAKDGGGHNADGNEVVRSLAATAVTAIAIYTGQPSEAEEFAG